MRGHELYANKQRLSFGKIVLGEAPRKLFVKMPTDSDLWVLIAVHTVDAIEPIWVRLAQKVLPGASGSFGAGARRGVREETLNVREVAACPRSIGCASG